MLYLGLHDEEGNKININDPLTVTQRQSGHFVSFIIIVQPDQAGPKYKHSNMPCRVCFKLPLYVYGIDDSIDTRITEKKNILLLNLVALDNGRNPDIGKLKKERRDKFQNAASKASKQNYYVMSMNYY